MTLTLDPPAPEILDDLTRRRFVSGSLGLGAIILTGCGGEDRETSTTPQSDRLPVTVDHQWGSTIVPSQPRRVAVVGLNEQDTLLALGVSRSPRPSGTASSPAPSGPGRAPRSATPSRPC